MGNFTCPCTPLYINWGGGVVGGVVILGCLMLGAVLY